jgi:hypothetical protein
MESSNELKIKSFNGTGNVVEFLKKVELHSKLKGYADEKLAQNLASRLTGPAFDVYMRLSDAEKNNNETIATELLKEFKPGQQDREEAIVQLQKRCRQVEEPTLTFAYKLLELVKLAYPDFNENTRGTIAKDYYVKGLHLDMQIALKSLANFATSNINDLAKETTRLQLAGINSFPEGKNYMHSSHATVNSVNDSVDNTSLVESIVNKVIDKLKDCDINDIPNASEQNSVDFIRSRESSRGRNYKPVYRRNTNNMKLKCRSCQSTEHLVKNCPTRFCQACGNRGHDFWNTTCPKYQ